MLDLLPRLACDVMVIAPEHDPLLDGGRGEALRSALGARPAGAGPAEFWHVEGAAHLMALPADAPEYRRRLGDFLARLPARSGDLSHAT
jgi:pimeloyl-ACP methyl ester carboxylesterase